MTANRAPTADELNGVKQDTVHWPAKSHRVVLTDSDGSEDPTVPILPAAGSKVQITDGTDDADVIVCDGHNGLVTISPGQCYQLLCKLV